MWALIPGSPIGIKGTDTNRQSLCHWVYIWSFVFTEIQFSQWVDYGELSGFFWSSFSIRFCSSLSSSRIWSYWRKLPLTLRVSLLEGEALTQGKIMNFLGLSFTKTLAWLMGSVISKGRTWEKSRNFPVNDKNQLFFLCPCY